MPSAAFGAAAPTPCCEIAEIAVDHRLQIGVEHRGREPLVFAEFRLHLATRSTGTCRDTRRRSASRIIASCAGLRNENSRHTAQASGFASPIASTSAGSVSGVERARSRCRPR